jgi:hypothetical protein
MGITKVVAVAVGISAVAVVTGCRVVLVVLAMSHFSPAVRLLLEAEPRQDLLQQQTRLRQPLQVQLELDQR